MARRLSSGMLADPSGLRGGGGGHQQTLRGLPQRRGEGNGAVLLRALHIHMDEVALGTGPVLIIAEQADLVADGGCAEPPATESASHLVREGHGRGVATGRL